MPTLPKSTSSPKFVWGSRCEIFSFMCSAFKSLFVLLFFFWVLYCMSFFCSSFDHCIVCPSFVLLLTIVLYVLLLFFFWPLYCMSFFCSSFDYCIVCPSSIYGFDLFSTVKFFFKTLLPPITKFLFMSKDTNVIILYVSSLPAVSLLWAFFDTMFLLCLCCRYFCRGVWYLQYPLGHNVFKREGVAIK